MSIRPYFFLEAMFPTLCIKHKLLSETPNEFENIVYRRKYTDKDINTHNLYHPVKHFGKQVYYRDMLDQS